MIKLCAERPSKEVHRISSKIKKEALDLIISIMEEAKSQNEQIIDIISWLKKPENPHLIKLKYCLLEHATSFSPLIKDFYQEINHKLQIEQAKELDLSDKDSFISTLKEKSEGIENSKTHSRNRI